MKHALLVTVAALTLGASVSADEFYGGMFARPLIGEAERADVRDSYLESRASRAEHLPRYHVERDYPQSYGRSVAPADTTVMGNVGRGLTREEVRRDAIQAMREGRIPSGEALDYPLSAH
jgi:hypothetical protein